MCFGSSAKTKSKPTPAPRPKPTPRPARPEPTPEESARAVSEAKEAARQRIARERYEPKGLQVSPLEHTSLHTDDFQSRAKLFGVKSRYPKGYMGENDPKSQYYRGYKREVVKGPNGRETVVIDGQAIGEGMAALGGFDADGGGFDGGGGDGGGGE